VHVRSRISVVDHARTIVNGVDIIMLYIADKGCWSSEHSARIPCWSTPLILCFTQFVVTLLWVCGVFACASLQPADVLRTRTQMGLVQSGASPLSVLRSVMATGGAAALMTGTVRAFELSRHSRAAYALL
jgi:hypothetical protein